MNQRQRLRTLAAAALMLTSGATWAQTAPVKLKFSIFSPDKEATYLSVFKPFAEAVNKDSGGAIEIELFPNGALGRSPVQQAQMVLDGVADIAWVIASYTPGRFQENEVFELPGLFNDLKEATVVFTRLVNSGKVKGYDDFFPIGLFGTAPYSLHARTPINSIADIKGLGRGRERDHQGLGSRANWHAGDRSARSDWAQHHRWHHLASRAPGGLWHFQGDQCALLHPFGRGALGHVDEQKEV